MDKKSPWLICLKWGLIFGVAAIVFEVVRMVARNLEFGNQPAFSLALIILYVLVLYAGIKEFKEHYPQRLSFGKAFLSCILISLVGCVLLMGYEVIQYTYIEPDGLEKRYEQSLANYRSAVEKDTVTSAEVQAYTDTLSKVMAEQKTLLLKGQDTTVDYAMQLEVQKGLDMLMQYYVASLQNDYKKRELTHLDTVWTLPNFSKKARRNLMNTLGLYENQNLTAASTPYVRQIVQNSENAMRDYNTADIRFEQKKGQIPHYTSALSYAAVNSFFSWIYALLVGIFVSVYHYRSKHAIDEVPVEEAEDVPEEMEDLPEEEIDNQEENV
ncbi:MAG: DUF4199 domain-containing protein [Bacteroidales bacterium]|nr:DUF4199 domain-containing protein [Bacteroidales bacterium]